MPVFGLNNGITPIIAYNYGARHRKRMLKTVKVSMFIAFCFTFIGFLAFEFIPKTLLGLFSASEDMLTIGIPALRIIGIHYLIAWFCIIAGTVFQALGKAVFSMIVSIMRQLFVLVPAAYILASIGGLHAVWWSFPIAEIISLIVSVAFLVVINRTIIQKFRKPKDIKASHSNLYKRRQKISFFSSGYLLSFLLLFIDPVAIPSGAFYLIKGKICF